MSARILLARLAAMRDLHPPGSPAYAAAHAAVLAVEDAAYSPPTPSSICSDHRHVWAYFAAAHLSACIALPLGEDVRRELSFAAGDTKKCESILRKHRAEIVEGGCEWADAMTEQWKARFGA